jgi:hypothetical protein
MKKQISVRDLIESLQYWLFKYPEFEKYIIQVETENEVLSPYFSINTDFGVLTISGEDESDTTNDIRKYVDLGLPSGLKWATCNVGATKPEEYGDYYAWGETITKGDYNRDNSKTYGKNMSDISGNVNYDAATANWGSSWRMPTKAEVEELVNNCTWTWTTQNGVNGMRVTGPNDNSIFLPAAGCYDGLSCYGINKSGYYWSSTPNKNNADNALELGFYSAYRSVDWSNCYYGLTIRPVFNDKNI